MISIKKYNFSAVKNYDENLEFYDANAKIIPPTILTVREELTVVDPNSPIPFPNGRWEKQLF